MSDDLIEELRTFNVAAGWEEQEDVKRVCDEAADRITELETVVRGLCRDYTYETYCGDDDMDVEAARYADKVLGDMSDEPETRSAIFDKTITNTEET